MSETTQNLKESDLSASQIQQFLKPKQTWFFKRGDGKIFAAEEREAWEILENRSNWRRHDFIIIGASDGTTYVNVLKSAGEKTEALKSELQQLKSEHAKYQKTEERLVFEELLDQSDEKVIRVKNIIAEYDQKIDALEEKLKSITSVIMQEAFDAELAQARENAKTEKIPYPTDQYFITPNVDVKGRKKVLRAMARLDD